MSAVIDPHALGERAWDHLNRLTALGPRPAGGEGERRARAYAAEVLHGLGFVLAEKPFHFPPQPRFFPYYLLPAAGFLLAAGLLPVAPWLSLGLPFLVLALPNLSDAVLARLPKTAVSANLLALPPGAGVGELDLLFCAHLDSARAVPAGPRFMQRLSAQIDDAAVRVAWLQAAAALLPLMGFPLAGVFHLAFLAVAGVLSAGLIAVDLWQQLGTGGAFSPGANDNASGAAVLLAVAGYLAESDPFEAKVGFLFTGAEEAGLYGAHAFAAQLAAAGQAPRVVNVDMIGAGDRLRLIERAGILRPRRTDPSLNALLERAEPEILRLVYRRRDGDFSAFLRCGIPAAGIEGRGTPRFWQAYHTLADTPERIDRGMLERTAAALAILAGLACKKT